MSTMVARPRRRFARRWLAATWFDPVVSEHTADVGNGRRGDPSRAGSWAGLRSSACSRRCRTPPTSPVARSPRTSSTSGSTGSRCRRAVRDHPRDRPRAVAWHRPRLLGSGGRRPGRAPLATVVGAFVAIAGRRLRCSNLVLEAGEEQGLVPEEWDPDRAAQFVANFVVVAAVAPIVEELTYRGLGLAVTRDRWGMWPAIAITSVAFGLAHGLLVALPVLDHLRTGARTRPGADPQPLPCGAPACDLQRAGPALPRDSRIAAS